MRSTTLYESVTKYENSGLSALRFDGHSISYKKLCKNIRRAAAYLRAHGIGEGDVVTLALPNIPATVYFFYAIDAVGAVANILHPLSTVLQVTECMKKTNSRHAILLETAAEEVCGQMSSTDFCFHFLNPVYDSSPIARRVFYLKYKGARGDGKRIFKADSFRRMREMRDITPRDTEESSVYLHSGGTTGEPKTIGLSDRAIENLSRKVDKIIDGKIEGMGMLAVLPAFHGFGLGMGIHAPLSHGATSCLMMKFNAKKAARMIDRGEVNFIIGVPLLYKKLMDESEFKKADLTRLYYCFVGGDNVQGAQIDEFNAYMEKRGSEGRMFEGYGLTETVTVCTVNTRASSKTGSVGRPLDGIVISVRDEFGVALGEGMTGEVYVSGDTVMCGYLSDREATEKTVVSCDGRLWVKTGDLGYIDSDGHLWLRGRMKRMFKLSGMNIYPAESEKTACSVEGISEAAMEYFEEPKPHTVLFVTKQRDCMRSEREMKEEIMAALTASQLKYSLPKDIVFLERFPETRVGKIDHIALSRSHLLRNTSE